jgi:chromosomal replication initiator protein
VSAISIRDVQAVVAEHYRLTIVDLIGPSRLRHVVRARQMAMSLAYSATRHSYPVIGREFRRHHTTVIHARKAIKHAFERDRRFVDLFDGLWSAAQVRANLRAFAA